MYNVIIVDDEITIREGLKRYLEDNVEGFDVCAIFGDGESAFNFLRENSNSVDVVFTDIRMNNVSGIELAQKIQENDIDVIIVFLSSYREFEYAKLAIKYNVFAYIEKPIDFYELDELFEDIRNHLSVKNKTVNNESLNERKLLITQILIEIYSGFFSSNEQLLAHIKRFGFGECAVKRPCAKFTIGIEQIENEWKYGIEGLETAIQNAFKFNNIGIYNIYSSNGSMDMLAVPDKFMSPFEENDFEKKISDVQKKGIADLNEIGIKLKLNELVFFDDLYSLNSSSRNLMQKNKTEKLKNALNMELLSGNFNEESRQKISDILSDLNLENYKVDLNALNIGNQNLANQSSINEINENCNTTIKKSLMWINENYNKNITLSDAANHVMLSPVYYGRLFKLNVGVGFIAYLSDYRLNKARHLLKDSLFNVSEVSNLVGYHDVNYFIKLFKKKYGVSPNEFKKQW